MPFSSRTQMPFAFVHIVALWATNMLLSSTAKFNNLVLSFTKLLRFMKKLILFILIFATSVSAQYLQSPNGNLSFIFKLNDKGEPTYSFTYNRFDVIKPSKFGFEIKDQPDLKDQSC